MATHSIWPPIAIRPPTSAAVNIEDGQPQVGSPDVHLRPRNCSHLVARLILKLGANFGSKFPQPASRHQASSRASGMREDLIYPGRQSCARARNILHRLICSPLTCALLNLPFAGTEFARLMPRSPYIAGIRIREIFAAECHQYRLSGRMMDEIGARLALLRHPTRGRTRAGRIRTALVVSL